MKKYGICILTLALCLIGTYKVKAYSSLNADCEAKGECMLLCNYTNTKYNSSSKNVKVTDRISIYYFYKQKNYDIYWTFNGNNKNKGKKTFTNTFGNSGTNVYLAGGLKLSENNFKCPNYGYIDYGAYGGNELCFANNNSSCSTEFNDANTKFGKANNLFINAAKDYDVINDIDVYYNSSAYRDYTCDEIIDYKTGQFKLTYAEFNADAWKDFDKNFLHGNAAPSFIEQYKKNRIDDLYNSIKNSRMADCANEDKKDVASGKMTQEEFERREEIRNNINWDQVKSDIEKGYGDYLEGIDYGNGEELGDPDKVLLPTDVEEINICEEGKVLLVFQVLGYILFVAKIVIPLLLIIMGSIDFAKAIIDSDEKAIKDAVVKFIKRFIAGVIIFFLPTIFNFIFSLVDGAVDNQKNFTGCTNCIFDPLGDCGAEKLVK